MDRLRDRLEQWGQPWRGTGQGAGRDRQPLVGHPFRHLPERPAAAVALVEIEGPDTGPEGGIGKEPGRRRCRDLLRRGGALAAPPPAISVDDPDMGLHLDLHGLGDMAAILHIGQEAAGTAPVLRRRVVALGLKLQCRTPGPAMAGLAVSLATFAAGARLLLLLGFIAEARFRMGGPRRAQLLALGPELE